MPPQRPVMQQAHSAHQVQSEYQGHSSQRPTKPPLRYTQSEQMRPMNDEYAANGQMARLRLRDVQTMPVNPEEYERNLANGQNGRYDPFDRNLSNGHVANGHVANGYSQHGGGALPQRGFARSKMK